jgi:Cu+-exporting ATPase
MFTLIAMGWRSLPLQLAAVLLLGAHHVYFEAAAVITTLVLLGQMLELRARAQTGSAIRALLNLAPQTASLLGPSGNEIAVPLAHVSPGNRLRVRPGDKVPVDVVVLEGSSAVDESMWRIIRWKTAGKGRWHA